MHSASLFRVLLFVVLASLEPVAWAGDALSFFNNWFVTGDYATAGVGLRGTAGAGTINMSGVPVGAEPIAAFLYWSTAEASPIPSARVGTFNGYQIQGAALGSSTTPNLACSSSGGTIDPNSNGRVYRADVLRYLPVDKNNIRQANGSFPVKLAASGAVLYNNGASLVVIYRIVKPGDPDEAPLRAVVIYNGAFTMNKNAAGMTQNIAGFYQASANSAPKMTSIVANGQPGFFSPLSVNGNILDSDPFIGAQKTRWDNPTYNFNLAANASYFSALATTSSNQTCLTWAAIISSVIVTDTDRDGLLDIWETKGLHRNTQVSPATFGSCSDYSAEPCENLPAMGADPSKRDIFVQMDWMNGSSGGNHDHMPKLPALSQVAATFALHGIRLHFDVGQSNNYQGNQPACGSAPCSFIIPGAYAQGGSDITESTLVCQNTLKHICDYHQPYPVLSFEFGFASVRDGNKLLNISPHFAQDRQNLFHYALFAHALGGPFNVNGQPVDPFTGQLTATPQSYSGIAHRPGGGFMVTFGLWRSDIPANDQVGSVQAQAGTIMHEMGHNLGLGHAGLFTKPNCMANYPSIMNYLYQIRGLTDAAGNAQVDFSSGLLFPISENFLSTSIPMSLPGIQRYKVRYYGPLAPNQTASQAAQLHCDGTVIKPGEPLEARLEGSAVSTPDWSNGTVTLGRISPPLDANYDGATGQAFFDQPDWLALNLRQIGTGYNFGGLSVGALATDGGAYATDGGALATDAGALATDGGAFATDGGAFATDGGAFATDGGVFATDGGAFATDGGAYATDAGDINQTTALLSSVDPPTAVSASNTTNSIVVSWTPPDNGQVDYNVYRCAGAGCVPAKPAFRNVTGGTATPSLIDTVNDYGHAGTACPATATCPNTTYVYSVTSLALVNAKLAESVFSKTANSEVKVQFVVADNKTVIYDGTNQSVSFHVYGDFTVALNQSLVSCPSSTNPARNVATYSISCTGPNTSSLTDGVVYVLSGGTYTDNAGTHTGGTLIINKRPITVTAASNTKTYDGTTSASASPTITTGTLGAGDSLNFSETYIDKNVGMGKTMIPSGFVNDSTGGNNYTVTFVNSANGKIDPAPLTITAKNQNKTYGTTFSFAGTEFTPGTLYSTDTVTSVTLTSSGTPATATVAGSTYPIVPSTAAGTGLTNYTITYANGTLTVNQAPASVTPNASSKTYGNSDPPFAGTLAGFVAADGVTATYGRVAGENVTGSPYAIAGTLSPASTLSNYSITYKTANFTINTAPASVTPDPKVITFGMPDPPLTGTLAGFLPADVVTATYGRAPGGSAGIYSISATLTPTGLLTNYSIMYNTASLTINRAPQAITFGTLSNQPFNAPDFPVSASSTSPLTVTFSTVSTNCSVTTAGMVHLIAPGNCTITAQQPGDGNYFSAANVSQSFTIGDGFASVDFTTLTRSSNISEIPIATASNITMTTDVGQASSVWFPNKQTVGNGFTTQFQFQITVNTPPPADGFAFVIQNSSSSALGTGGGSIGYQGIPNSLAIEFDTYLNSPYDPDANHIAVQSNGSAANSSDHSTANLGLFSLASPTLADGMPHTVKITYDGTSTMAIFVDENQVLSAGGASLNNLILDTGGKAFIGFTSATGAAGEQTIISNWSFSANQ